MVIYCPTDNDDTDNLTDHSQCLFVVFSFVAIFDCVEKFNLLISIYKLLSNFFGVNISASEMMKKLY